MIRSSLVKSACVAIALLGLSAPQARAGTVVVLHRPDLSAGILGRLPVGQGLCGPAEASMLRPSRLGEAVSNYRDGGPRRALSVSYRTHPYSRNFAATALPASYLSTASPMVAKKDSWPI